MWFFQAVELLDRMVPLTGARDKAVRFRSCQLTSKLLNRLFRLPALFQQTPSCLPALFQQTPSRFLLVFIPPSHSVACALSASERTLRFQRSCSRASSRRCSPDSTTRFSLLPPRSLFSPLLFPPILVPSSLSPSVNARRYQPQTPTLAFSLQQVPVVRVHAAAALARLQDPTDADDSVTSEYMRMVGSDTSKEVRLSLCLPPSLHISLAPSSQAPFSHPHQPLFLQVRKAVLANMGVSSVTLQNILDRARDVREDVRKYTFNVIAIKIDVKALQVLHHHGPVRLERVPLWL